MTAPVIFGCAGQALGAEEAAFFRQAQPWGFILFGRNIASPGQVRQLTAALRACVGRRDAPILIDQEGGRVQRLGPPHWRRFPAARAFGALRAAGPELARLAGRLIAHDLLDLGVTVDCLPVLDVPTAGAHEVIGDRAYGLDPTVVTDLGRAVADGLLAGAVAPVVKHIPGHGRAAADSHHALPRVQASFEDLDERDFAPFRALADMPMAMTAHVVYAAVDAERPATLSPIVIERVIRGAIGFDGLLISDDLSMRALSGDLAERAERSLAAGCDVVLHCNGELAEMQAIAAQMGGLEGKAAQRAAAALARIDKRPDPFDATAAARRFFAAFEEAAAG